MTEPYESLDGPRVPRDPEPREVRADFRAAVGKRLGIGGVVLALLLGLGGIAYNVYAIRQTQVDNKPVLRDTRAAADAAVSSAADAARTADRIEDCTTPGGSCFNRAQADTGAAVSGINTVTIRATACLVAFLDTTPSNLALTPDQIAARIKRCVQSGKTTVTPSGAGSDILPRPTPTSAASPRRPSGTPSPSGPPTRRPPQSPREVCILGICLPLGLSVLLAAPPSVVSVLVGTVRP